MVTILNKNRFDPFPRSVIVFAQSDYKIGYFQKQKPKRGTYEKIIFASYWFRCTG
jgi:hypothetical protein